MAIVHQNHVFDPDKEDIVTVSMARTDLEKRWGIVIAFDYEIREVSILKFLDGCIAAQAKPQLKPGDVIEYINDFKPAERFLNVLDLYSFMKQQVSQT